MNNPVHAGVSGQWTHVTRKVDVDWLKEAGVTIEDEGFERGSGDPRPDSGSDTRARLFCLKMRASRGDEHISGAERIVEESSVPMAAETLVTRALTHAKGHPDFVNIKAELVLPKAILHLKALPVTTHEVRTAVEGRALFDRCLQELGIGNAAAILAKLPETYGMRGAMLLNVDTLERLEPDSARGIRATYMDADASCGLRIGCSKDHYAEAIVLATKVANAPGVIGELCISDDPDYVTGYFASARHGYFRITKLKEPGDPNGGRIFLFRGDRALAERAIDFLERRPVLVTGIPVLPTAHAGLENRMTESLAAARAAHLARELRVRVSPQEASVTGADGCRRVMLASNDYLGLANDPRVRAAAVDAIGRYGYGTGASRLISGTTPAHAALEQALAAFKGTERALVFNSGYAANVGVISALLGKGDVVFSDALNHASIIDGCRLSGARIVVYAHNDMADLERKIVANRAGVGLVVSDGVFSMDGDIVKLPELLAIAKRYGLFSMIDEAHATGVVGQTGRGVCEHFGLTEHPDVLMGTLSKALGSEGGFVCGSALLIDYLVNSARSFIFSTALPAASVAAAKAALEIVVAEPGRVAALRRNVAAFIAALRQEGIETSTESAIVPILVGDEAKALALAAGMNDAGFAINAIRYPTVAKGAARLRAAVMATHTVGDLQAAARALGQLVRRE